MAKFTNLPLELRLKIFKFSRRNAFRSRIKKYEMVLNSNILRRYRAYSAAKNAFVSLDKRFIINFLDNPTIEISITIFQHSIYHSIICTNEVCDEVYWIKRSSDVWKMYHNKTFLILLNYLNLIIFL